MTPRQTTPSCRHPAHAFRSDRGREGKHVQSRHLPPRPLTGRAAQGDPPPPPLLSPPRATAAAPINRRSHGGTHGTAATSERKLMWRVCVVQRASRHNVVTNATSHPFPTLCSLVVRRPLRRANGCPPLRPFTVTIIRALGLSALGPAAALTSTAKRVRTGNQACEPDTEAH